MEVLHQLTTAGTIAAFLMLDASDFNRGIKDAIKLLANLSDASDGSSGVLEKLGGAASAAAGIITGSLISAVGGAATAGKQTSQTTAEAISYLTGKFSIGKNLIIGDAVSAGNAVGSSLKAIKERLKSTADSAEAAGAAGKKAAKAAAAGVEANIISIKTSIASLGTVPASAGKTGKEIAAAIKTPLSGLPTAAYSIMTNVGASLNKGLAAKKNVIISTAADLASSVTKTMKSALKIASPSKVMRKIGEQTGQGLAIGLEDIRPEVSRQANMLAGSITGQGYAAGVQSNSTEGIASLAEKLDRIISLVAGGEQAFMVDGRAFARLIKEYS